VRSGFILSVLFAATALTAIAADAPAPWDNTALSPDQRAKLLDQALTPQERMGLLHGIHRTTSKGWEVLGVGTAGIFSKGQETVNLVAAVCARSTPAPIDCAPDPAGAADSLTFASVTVGFLQDALDRRG